MVLQDSGLKNSMDRGVWWATVHGVAELDMSMHTHAQKSVKFYKFFMESALSHLS